MFFGKRKKEKRAKFDTSKSAYEYMGIHLTDEQYRDLEFLNAEMRQDIGGEIPIHYVLVMLKCLGLLPTEIVADVGDDETTDDSQYVRNHKLQKRYGVLKKIF